MPNELSKDLGSFFTIKELPSRRWHSYHNALAMARTIAKRTGKAVDVLEWLPGDSEGTPVATARAPGAARAQVPQAGQAGQFLFLFPGYAEGELMSEARAIERLSHFDREREMKVVSFAIGETVVEHTRRLLQLAQEKGMMNGDSPLEQEHGLARQGGRLRRGLRHEE